MCLNLNVGIIQISFVSMTCLIMNFGIVGISLVFITSLNANVEIVALSVVFMKCLNIHFGLVFEVSRVLPWRYSNRRESSHMNHVVQQFTKRKIEKQAY